MSPYPIRSLICLFYFFVSFLEGSTDSLRAPHGSPQLLATETFTTPNGTVHSLVTSPNDAHRYVISYSLCRNVYMVFSDMNINSAELTITEANLEGSGTTLFTCIRCQQTYPRTLVQIMSKSYHFVFITYLINHLHLFSP